MRTWLLEKRVGARMSDRNSEAVDESGRQQGNGGTGLQRLGPFRGPFEARLQSTRLCVWIYWPFLLMPVNRDTSDADGTVVLLLLVHILRRMRWPPQPR